MDSRKMHQFSLLSEPRNSTFITNVTKNIIHCFLNKPLLWFVLLRAGKNILLGSDKGELRETVYGAHVYMYQASMKDYTSIEFNLGD